MPYLELKELYDLSMFSNDFESARVTAEKMLEKRYTGAESLLYFALIELQKRLTDLDNTDPISRRIEEIDTTILIF